MGDLINGRTPEEIKHVLAWANYSCGGLDCDDCSYQDVCSHENERRAVSDAIAYIDRLETKLARQDALLAVMGVRVPEEKG